MNIFDNLKNKTKKKLKEVYVEHKKINCRIDIREVFMTQNKARDFNRYDIVVRYLFIEELFGRKSHGFDLYKKMQKKRAGSSYDANCIEKFKHLIHSYQEEGYKGGSAIKLGANLQLIDGSHRIATGLYFGQYEIEAIITPIRTEYDYSIDWFIINDFTDDEILIIREKYSELKGICNKAFQCIMWPPMMHYFDQAMEDLKKLTTVLSYQDYTFTRSQLEFFIRGVYAVDDIEAWKIEKKIENMLYKAVEDLYKVRVLALKVDCPDFRLKQLNNKTLSRRGEKIKSVIRAKYKDKITNYYYDNIMHIADNFFQSEHISLLKDIRIDLTDFFDQVKNEQYVMTKLEVPYMPCDFPRNAPLGKDIDILCTSQSLERLVAAAEKYRCCYDSHFSLYRRQLSIDRIQVRIELNEVTVFIWDFTSKEDGLAREFIANSVHRYKEYNGIKTQCQEFEYIYRTNLVRKKPKDYHIQYLENHKNDFSPELEKEYLEG